MIGVVEAPFTWEFWPQARELLCQSAARLGETIEEIEEELKGNAVLWVAVTDSVKFAAVGQIFKGSKGAELFIWHGAGDFIGHGCDVMASAEQWCRENGLSAMEMNGRLGWMRRLKDWRAVSVILRKEL